MDIQEFVDSQKEFLEDLVSRTARKQVEYARGTNAFHNFNAATGLAFADSNAKIAWEFNVKHLQSLKDIIEDISNGGEVSEHHIDEKVGDIIVYMTLIRDMLKEESMINNHRKVKTEIQSGNLSL